ncbi:GDSL-type esterase/lipase family protein [Nitrospinae bacterium]|nr:GDSL-type esterase/lipase family protein [Nitrospinota bacterium]
MRKKHWDTNAKNNHTNLIQKIVFILISSLLGVIICELIIAYPVYYFFNDHEKKIVPIKSSFYNRVIPEDLWLFKEDPIVGYVLNKNLNIKKPQPPGLKNAPRRKMFFDLQTNKYGFRYRDDLTKDKPVGEIRIFSLGGSTTMGAESSNEMTYPQQLESMIGDPNVRIINTGVDGYRSIHLLHYYKEVIRELSPDIITIYSGWNDYEDSMMPYWKPRDPHVHALLSQIKVYQHPISKFALGFLTMKTYYRLRNFDRVEIQTSDSEIRMKSIEGAKDHKWWEEYKTNIQDLISLAKSDGVTPVLIIFPSPEFENAPLEAKEFSETDLNMAERWDGFVVFLGHIRSILKELAKKNNVPIINVNQRFEKENPDFIKKFSYFVDRMHLTPEGNTLIAETMVAPIKNILKIRNQQNSFANGNKVVELE